MMARKESATPIKPDTTRRIQCTPFFGLLLSAARSVQKIRTSPMLYRVRPASQRPSSNNITVEDKTYDEEVDVGDGVDSNASSCLLVYNIICRGAVEVDGRVAL
jgi:hypothetical protein